MSTEQPIRGVTPPPIAPPNVADPTFEIRRKQANLCEATMMRVVELECHAKQLTREAEGLMDIAKKLRAAVVANT
jgi:hypothetical protein